TISTEEAAAGRRAREQETERTAQAGVSRATPTTQQKRLPWRQPLDPRHSSRSAQACAAAVFRLNPADFASLKNICTVSSEYSPRSLPTSDSFLRMSFVAVMMWQPTAS